MKLTERDSQILDSLSRKVRLLSLRQIAKHWWPQCDAPETAARRSLARLVNRELLKAFRVLAHPLPQLSEAVLCWQPGEPRPNPARISWRLQSRWTEAPIFEPAFIATKRAKQLFGGNSTASLTRPIQATHDLGMAEVYLWFLSTRRKEAGMWLGEDVQTPGERSKNPDAQLFNSAGEAIKVIEFGGSYATRRVSSFHHYCVRRAMPYEIW